MFVNNRLILGTAQLGLPYGIANTSGQPNQITINKIIATAWEGGIKYFDTAIGYGTSEISLGKALVDIGIHHQSNIITKLSPNLPDNIKELKENLFESLRRLNINKLHCLMLHRENQLSLLDDWVGDFFIECKKQKIIKNIGISVYSPKMAILALQHSLIDIVQIPASLFDRRMENAGVFSIAKKLKKILHVRSIFLQGVLTMVPEKVPTFLNQFIPSLRKLNELCAQEKISPVKASIAWILQKYPHTFIIFGAERVDQIKENLDGTQLTNILSSSFFDKLDEIVPPQEEDLLNPSLWRVK